MILSQALFDEMCLNFFEFRNVHSLLLSSLGEEGIRQQYGSDTPILPFLDFFGPLNDIVEDALASKAKASPSPVPTPQPEAGPSNLRPQRLPTPELALPDEFLDEDQLARETMEVEDVPQTARKGKGRAVSKSS